MSGTDLNGDGAQIPNPVHALNLFARTATGLGVCSLYGAGIGVVLLIACLFAGVDKPPMNMKPGLFYFLLCLPGTGIARYLLTSNWNLRRKLITINRLYQDGLITRGEKITARKNIMQFYSAVSFAHPASKTEPPPYPPRQPLGFGEPLPGDSG